MKAAGLELRVEGVVRVMHPEVGMGVEFTQHPELWNAVVIQVPLLLQSSVAASITRLARHVQIGAKELPYRGSRE